MVSFLFPHRSITFAVDIARNESSPKVHFTTVKSGFYVKRVYEESIMFFCVAAVTWMEWVFCKSTSEYRMDLVSIIVRTCSCMKLLVKMFYNMYNMHLYQKHRYIVSHKNIRIINCICETSTVVSVAIHIFL